MINYKYGNVDYRINLIDDGTLDTVLEIAYANSMPCGHRLRFDYEYAIDTDGTINEYALTDLIEDYLENTVLL